MKRAENVVNNDYIIRLTEEVKNDKEFFINECNINHELYDPEVAEYLNGFKKLNEIQPMKLFGGCQGTDNRHMEAVAESI